MTNSDGAPARDDTKASVGKGLNRLRNLVLQGAAELSQPRIDSLPLSEYSVVIGPDAPLLRHRDTEEMEPLTAQSLEALAKSHSNAALDLVVLDDGCIDLSFSLPDALLPELRQIIELETSFRSPFSPDVSVAFWVAEEQKDGKWRARAAVMLRTVVDPVLTLLSEHGFTVDVVRRAGKSIGFAARPAWVGHAAASKSRSGLRGLPAGLKLSLLGAVVFCASTIAAATSDRFTLSQVSAEAETARATLAAQAQSMAGVRALDQSLALATQKLALTGKLSELLPDGVWLDQLIIDDDTVTLVGFGPSAADITRLLTSLPELSDIRFGSPVTRDNTQALERFRIVATLESATP